MGSQDPVLYTEVAAIHKWVDINLTTEKRNSIHFLYQKYLKDIHLPLHASIEAGNQRSFKHFMKYGFKITAIGILKVE